MSIKQRLEDDLKQSMKSRDTTRVSCLRMLKARLLEREVALRAKQGRDHQITDEEGLEVIAAYAKQRRDSIDSYRQGGREELVAQEEKELAIVSEFLPQPLSEDELKELVREAIAESGATSAREMGQVMKRVMARTKGRADGKLVNRLVRDLLGEAG
jgi:uncharacterized protein YqeY